MQVPLIGEAPFGASGPRPASAVYRSRCPLRWSATRTVGVLMMTLMTGCASPHHQAPLSPDLIDAAAGSPAVIAPGVAPSNRAAEPADPGRSTDPGTSAPALLRAVPAVAPATAALMSKAPSTVALPSVPPLPPLQARSAAKAAVPVPAPARPAPPLDLKSLEARLKATSGIGVFTKLALKNQVDDLLAQFRAHYSGQQKATLAELRQAYDRLLLKVLALLQDADPPLARAIASSRESIWDILSNPAKFAAV